MTFCRKIYCGIDLAYNKVYIIIKDNQLKKKYEEKWQY